MSNQVERKKNWAIYILFILAVIAGILAFVDAGRYMGWIPINATIPGLGEISFAYPQSQWFAALMQALLGAIWFVVAYWLWTLNPSGWMFVIVISVVNLIFLALALLGRTTFSQVLPALLVNALAFLLAFLPGTREAFIQPLPSDEDGQAAKAAAAAAADEAATRTPEAPAMDAGLAETVEAAGTDAPVAEAAVVDGAGGDVPAVGDVPEAGDVSEAGAQPAVQDLDLTVVEGIGPKISAALNAAGVNSIYKLAAISQDELRGILRDAGLSADPATWSKQAALVVAGNMDELKAYQDKLQGGREV